METEILTLEPTAFRHGEVKSLLVERMRRLYPSFRFLTAATGVYHFQRLRDFRDYDLKEAIHFVFSPADYSMRVSISSILNPVHSLSHVYNNGFINPHIDLGSAIKINSIFPSDNTAYYYKKSIESLACVIDEAFNDIGTHGLEYMDCRYNSLQENELVHTGMDVIDTWSYDKTMLRNELNVQLRKAKQLVSKLRHPICNDLRYELESVRNQKPNDIKQIPRLAFELIELYCNSRITP